MLYLLASSIGSLDFESTRRACSKSMIRSVYARPCLDDTSAGSLIKVRNHQRGPLGVKPACKVVPKT